MSISGTGSPGGGGTPSGIGVPGCHEQLDANSSAAAPSTASARTQRTGDTRLPTPCLRSVVIVPCVRVQARAPAEREPPLFVAELVGTVTVPWSVADPRTEPGVSPDTTAATDMPLSTHYPGAADDRPHLFAGIGGVAHRHGHAHRVHRGARFIAGDRAPSASPGTRTSERLLFAGARKLAAGGTAPEPRG